MIKKRTQRVLLLGVCTLLITLTGCNIFSSQGDNPPANITPITLTPDTTSTPAPISSTDWTTYHRNNSRTGLVENAPDPHQLTQAWSVKLDGAVYAEPLVIGSNVIVATEGDSLYALDSHTGRYSGIPTLALQFRYQHYLVATLILWALPAHPSMIPQLG